MTKKITKTDIENMVYELINYMKENGYMGDYVQIFANGKLWQGGEEQFVGEDMADPSRTMQYCNPDNIMTMNFEDSELYSILNFYCGVEEYEKVYNDLEKIFEKVGAYYELGDSWNLSLYPMSDDYEIETTPCKKKRDPDPIYIDRQTLNEIPVELRLVDHLWSTLQKEEGDVGSCVLGASLNFTYKDEKYEMPPLGPWQGSLSWERSLPTIMDYLQKLGATDIRYNPGRLD